MKVIIVGAGASGLIAANILAKNAVDVTVLEASDRIGGRIHTFVPPNFSNHIEAGAEFIHGNLPLTLQLMKKAGLPYEPISGKMYRFENGQLGQNFGRGKGWDKFYALLESLKKDCTIQEFLETHFAANEYDHLRKEVGEMAQGLDLADISKLSVLSIREEWLSDETQYRPVSGYAPLLEFIRNDAISENFELILNQKISTILWKPGQVEVVSEDKKYVADAAIITTSLGNLHHRSITFEPKIESTYEHFNAIGFGQVIKMVFEFKTIFWNEKYPDLGFLFTDNGMTFWSQLSQKRPILTGWIGDGYVQKYDPLDDEQLMQSALEKLDLVFAETDVKRHFKAGIVFRYTTYSESRGGYSWLTTKSKPAIKKINQGIENTIWFAGEALHPGAEVGTVEAALQSGKFVAGKILKNKKK